MNIWTSGLIAKTSGKPQHKVEYVIKSRGIKPIARAASANIYSDADADRIVAELQKIDQQRKAG
ncbi:MAG TPA: hypothetical protein VFC78_01230 [Tepidisphaeraceae bacterium]|nr:hypothetical protein [Tepidisphaeraceae bacterium]